MIWFCCYCLLVINGLRIVCFVLIVDIYFVVLVFYWLLPLIVDCVAELCILDILGLFAVLGYYWWGLVIGCLLNSVAICLWCWFVWFAVLVGYCLCNCRCIIVVSCLLVGGVLCYLVVWFMCFWFVVYFICLVLLFDCRIVFIMFDCVDFTIKVLIVVVCF